MNLERAGSVKFNLLLNLAITILAYCFTLTVDFSRMELEALIFVVMPFSFFVITAIAFLIARIFTAKYGFIITIIGGAISLYYAVFMHYSNY